MRGSRKFRKGGGPGQSDRKSSDNFFFSFPFFLVLSLFLRKSNGQFQRNLSFFKVSEGVQNFPGGSNFFQLLIPYRNPYNLWFSRGGSGPPAPPPSGSALASIINKWVLHLWYKPHSRENDCTLRLWYICTTSIRIWMQLISPDVYHLY